MLSGQVLSPTAKIAGDPGAVGCPGYKNCNSLVHDRRLTLLCSRPAASAVGSLGFKRFGLHQSVNEGGDGIAILLRGGGDLRGKVVVGNAIRATKGVGD